MKFNTFQSILGGSLQNLLPSTDRLVKAKSDGSLASTTTTATVTDASLNKMKSRSLEPLTGLAMWSSEPQIIQLVKGERGLGFSILDYQVIKYRRKSLFTLSVDVFLQKKIT